MNLSPIQKQKLTALYPDLRDWIEQRETNQLLTGLFSQIKLMKGDKGDTGATGYSPVKGKDYFTDKEVGQIIAYVLKQATPKKGIDYVDGQKGDNYVLTSKDKKEIASSIEVPIVEKVIEKTEVVKEVIPKNLDVSSIKNAVSKKDLEAEKKSILDGMTKQDGRIKLLDQRWHGGGLSKVVTDSTLSGNGTSSSPLTVIGGGSGFGNPITISGTIDDSNTTFTAASQPNILLINGGIYQQTGGSITWTWSSGTITLSVPVGSGGNIVGF